MRLKISDHPPLETSLPRNSSQHTVNISDGVYPMRLPVVLE